MTEAQKQEVILHLKDTQTLIKYLNEQSRTDKSLSVLMDVYDDVFEELDSIINKLGETE